MSTKYILNLDSWDNFQTWFNGRPNYIKFLILSYDKICIYFNFVIDPIHKQPTYYTL